MPHDLLEALRRAREAAEAHISAAEAAEGDWGEETVTELVLLAAAPTVRFAQFNKRQESLVGADWLWWWVDDAGECFGMLTQAKRLHRRRGRLEIDFYYGGGQQMARLMQSADDLLVPAMYAVYLGTPTWRAPTTCRLDPHPDICARCHRATVSLLSALQAQLRAPSPIDAAHDAIYESTPLEDLGNADVGSEPIFGFHLSELDPEVRNFLTRTQTGARHVAREVFRRVAVTRAGQFEAATMDRVDAGQDALFPTLPDDRGHFSRPYYSHVLRGLRRQPPSYLEDALTGDPPDEIAERASGIVVVRC